MKDCYSDLRLHLILLYDASQSYILKLRDRAVSLGLSEPRRFGYSFGPVEREDVR